MSYDNVHRYLLRTVGSRGVISVAEALRILSEITDSENESIQDLVKDINDSIRPFHQKIKKVHDDLNDEEVLLFVSMADDDISKAQNFFSASELEYFRVLLEQIVTTDSRQITRINALNLVSSMKSSFTKTDAERLLKTWCKMRYLDMDDKNYILGLRTVHEFEAYFRQNMPDFVEECCLCKQIVFTGYNCPNTACGLAVHTRCLNGYVKNVSKWPCCKVDFRHEQLESLNSYRHSQNDSLEPTQVIEQNTELQATDDLTQQVNLTQDIVPEVSQRITRKRKLQT